LAQFIETPLKTSLEGHKHNDKKLKHKTQVREVHKFKTGREFQKNAVKAISSF